MNAKRTVKYFEYTEHTTEYSEKNKLRYEQLQLLNRTSMCFQNKFL